MLDMDCRFREERRKEESRHGEGGNSGTSERTGLQHDTERRSVASVPSVSSLHVVCSPVDLSHALLRLPWRGLLSFVELVTRPSV